MAVSANNSRVKGTINQTQGNPFSNTNAQSQQRNPFTSTKIDARGRDTTASVRNGRSNGSGTSGKGRNTTGSTPRNATNGTQGRPAANVQRTPRGRLNKSGPQPRSQAGKPSHQAEWLQDDTSRRLPPDQRLQALKRARVGERKAAIDDGFMADPDVPRPLSEAITLVGTCEDMCPEYERVTRMVQNDVWRPEYEKSIKTAHLGYGNQVVDESRMVKKFRRPAAGIEEQIPSDLRPPRILQKTVAYLVDEVVGAADGFEGLKEVHNFVWDRTRGIRNDFSVQQLRDVDGLKIAINCFERIVRFHLLTRHQIGGQQAERGEGYDHQQDLEQCIKGLISLIAYYDIAREKGYVSPNEAEFRAYWIITRIPEKREQDVEAKVQSWPWQVQGHPRVQTALEVYAAACSASNPRTGSQVIARQNYRKFWRIVGSTRTSYLMACTAEIFFDIVRKSALYSIVQTYSPRGRKTQVPDWTLSEVRSALGFDTEDEAQEYVEAHGFQVKQASNQQWFLDIVSNKSVTFGHLISIRPPRVQSFSNDLVEYKRYRRTLPAIINGLPFREAVQADLLEDEDDASEVNDEQGANVGREELDEESAASLFVPMDEGQDVWTPRGGGILPQQSETTNAEPSKLDASAPAFNPFAPSKATSSQTAFNPFNVTTKPAAPNGSVASINPFASTTTPSATPTFPDLGQSIFSRASAKTSTTTTSTVEGPSVFSFAPTANSIAAPPEDKQQATPSSMKSTPATSSSIFKFSEQSSSSIPKPVASFFPPASVASSSSTTPVPSSIAVLQEPTFTASNPIFSSPQSHLLTETSGAIEFPITKKDATVKPSSVFDSLQSTPSFFSPPKPFMTLDANKSFNLAATAPTTTQQAAQAAQSTPPTPSKFAFAAPAAKPTEPAASADSPATHTSTKHVSFNSSVEVRDNDQAVTVIEEANTVSHAKDEELKTPRSILKRPSLQQEVPTVSTTSSPTTLPNPAPPRKPDGPTPRQQRYDECADYLARQLLLDSHSGFLYQYIAYNLQSIFNEEKTRYEDEVAAQEVGAFRRNSLVRRYGRFWRHRAVASMRKRQASTRRQRMHEAAMRRSVKVQDERALIQSSRPEYQDSMNMLLPTTSHAEKLIKEREAARKDRFGKELPSSLGQGAKALPLHLSNVRIPTQPPRSSIRAHRRSKTASERFSGPQNPGRDMLRSTTSSESLRTSFLHTDQLADSMRSNTPSGRVSTFSSNYFKLKARGLTHLSDAFTDRTRKRARLSSEQDSALDRLHTSLSQSASRSPSQDMNVRHSSSVGEIQPTSFGIKRKAATSLVSPLSTKRSKEDVTKEDEELFARARAVQNALSEGISVYKSEMEELRKSDSAGRTASNHKASHHDDTDHPLFNASVISFASPVAKQHAPESRASLVQSMRASRQEDVLQGAQNKLPAFWFRESKFVPRSDYGLAPMPKRARTVTKPQSSNQNQDDGQSSATSMQLESESNSKSKNDHIQLAQGALSHLSNGSWDSYNNELNVAQAGPAGEEYFLEEISTNGDNSGQQYDEAFLEQDFAQTGHEEEELDDDHSGRSGDSTVDEEDARYEEDYDDFLEEEEYGSETEGSDDDEHMPPAHLQGGNSIEDAIEL